MSAQCDRPHPVAHLAHPGAPFPGSVVAAASPHRRSAGPTPPRRERARARAPTAAASTTRGAATPRTSTRTTAARPPASPAPRTTRATRTPPLSSRCCRRSPRCCRPRAALPRLQLPRRRCQPHCRRLRPRPAPPRRHRSRHRPCPSPRASPSPLLPLLPTRTSSRPLRCTRRESHRRTLPCSP